MIGFLSNIPTLYVGPGTGVGTIGRVGIGTVNPQGDFQVGDGPNTKFLIRTDGRVIIGTKTMVTGPHDIPSTLFSVNGAAIFREVYVTQNNWADSVLRSDYNLIPLSMVKNYIDSTGHLPGVPSELDVKANGNNVGQTDVILLAKVEELTLYMIELQKQNDLMKKEIEELRKQR
ncbi:MAG: hypothetical protein ABIS12_17860 [Bacteroidia bacterium]